MSLCSVFSGVNTGRALVVQSAMPRSLYRPGFDVVSSMLLGLPGGDLWHHLPPLVPAKRNYLLTFQVGSGLNSKLKYIISIWHYIKH